MTNSKPRQKVELFAFDEPKERWYHHALRRLPGSLLVSFLMMTVVIPGLFFLGMTIYLYSTR